MIDDISTSRTARTLLSRHRLAAVLGCVAITAFCACEVVIDPGSGISISIANRLFTFTLGSVGQLQPRVSADPVRTAGVVPLFDGQADDNPGSAAIQLDPANIQVVPLSTARVTGVDFSGSAEIVVRIAPGDSTSPCTEGIDIGTFYLTFANGNVYLADGSLEVPFAALAYVISGQFTICLEATATVDVDMTITMIDCVFGPIVDADGGCTSSTECLDGFTCDSGACVAATPTGCTRSSDCDSGEVCTAGTCISTSASCTQDTDCQGGEVCTDGQCVPVSTTSCTENSDCQGGEVCTDGVCMPVPTACTTNSDCQGGEICSNGVCTAVSTDECMTDADCESNQTCVDKQCVDMTTTGTCQNDDDCDAGQECVDGACQEPAGFVAADIVHRGSELIVADYDIDSSRGVQLNGQYTVIQTAISGDGTRIWLNTYAQFPPDGMLNSRLYSVNIDGSGGQEATLSSANLQANAGQPGVDTNLDGSVAVLASGFNSTIVSRVTPGGTAQVITDSAPCTRSAWRLSDDGSRIVYSSFCVSDIYTLDVSGGSATATVVADDTAFTSDGQPLSSVDPAFGGFDMSADGQTWVVDAFFSSNGTLIPTIPIGTGLAAASIANQPGVDQTLVSIDDVSITDDGQTVGYCGDFSSADTLGRCYVQDVGASSRFEFTDADELTDIRRMVLADDGSRAYVQTADNSAYGYFQTVGQHDRLQGGTGGFFSPNADVFLNAQLSDDGMTLAAPVGGLGYVLRDGVDGLPGFPVIDAIQYSFDDEADTMTIRAVISPAGGIREVLLLPFHDGIEPARAVPEEENPFFSIRFGGLLAESKEDSGTWELTFSLNGKKSFINEDYRMRLGAVDDANNRAVFQDFAPLP